MEHWEFDYGTNGNAWRWLRVLVETGCIVRCSVQDFARIDDCLADAIKHGYVPGLSKIAAGRMGSFEDVLKRPNRIISP